MALSNTSMEDGLMLVECFLHFLYNYPQFLCFIGLLQLFNCNPELSKRYF